jgi:hypothetical protein
MSTVPLVGSKRPKLTWRNPTIRLAIPVDTQAVREADRVEDAGFVFERAPYCPCWFR